MTFATSRVFEAARATKTRLLEQTWPTVKDLPAPKVAFADVSYYDHGEVIQIATRIGDDGEIRWRSLPNGRDEVFDLDITVTTDVGYTDEDDAVNRVEQLADIVQRSFYDERTPEVKPLGIVQATKLEGIGQVAFQVLPSETAGCWLAEARLVYRLNFRI